MIILNDLHLGVNRQAGTTPNSQAALKKWLYLRLREVLRSQAGKQNLVINGDLFDGFEVAVSDVIDTYELLDDWLFEQPYTLTLVMGNHDASAKADKVSSFHLLAHFLQAKWRDRVQVVDHNNGLTAIDRDNCVWAISHQLNQDLFEIELDKAEGFGPCLNKERHSFLLLHANVNSCFAEHSDHSLNVSQERIGSLIKAGWTLVFGHEHIGYVGRSGRLVVIGNQFPSSIVDCIGNEQKQFMTINQREYKLHTSWEAPGSYLDIDWRELSLDAVSGHQFVRVSGEATAEEAADMVGAIAKLRQKSDAFVISNGVKVGGMVEMGKVTEMSLEEVSRFNVMEALLETLSEREQEVVKGLL